MTDEERAAVRQGVERAAATLDEIIEEVSREVFVSEAAAYVYSDSPEVALADAVRGAVVRRLEWLDANFLVALGGYTEAARKLGNGQLVELLAMLRQEVLDQVTLRMPPSVRVLDAALQHDRMAARLKVLRAALGGGGDGVPAADMESLSATANQFVDDMEDQEEVADRVLLARLVLVREELRALHQRAKEREAGRAFTGTGGAGAAVEGAVKAGGAAAAGGGTERGGRLVGPEAPAGGGGEATSTAGTSGGEGGGGGDDVASVARDSAAADAAAADDGGFFGFHRGNVPRRCAAFVQALLGVGDAPRRLALLRKAFNEDWDGAGPSRPPDAAAAAAPGSPDEAPDVVRPGRLLSAIHALRRELLLQRGACAGVSAGSSSSSSGGSSGGGVEGGGGDGVGVILKRLNQIQIEAALVLDEMQRGKAAGGGGGGGGGGGEAAGAGN